MKPETFADLVLGCGDQLVEGYKTGADNEKYAQVIIDKAIKTRWGASTEHPNFGGTKIREIAYPNLQSKGQTADFGVIYSRPKPAANKDTAYFVEVKCESGSGKGRFSGESWKKAFGDDIEKLKPVSGWIDYVRFSEMATGRPVTAKRCFAVLLAFHAETSARIISNYNNEFPGSVCKAANVGLYTFCVLVMQV